MIDWTITFHNKLADIELEELAVTASEFGINDFTITSSGRILVAETDRDDDSIRWIAGWLAEGLFEPENIALISEKRDYWPEFEEQEEFRVSVDFDGRDH